MSRCLASNQLRYVIKTGSVQLPTQIRKLRIVYYQFESEAPPTQEFQPSITAIVQRLSHLKSKKLGVWKVGFLVPAPAVLLSHLKKSSIGTLLRGKNVDSQNACQ
jgi:hypothetical protein